MTSAMRILAVLIGLSLPGAAAAQPKKPAKPPVAACGAKILPLAEGNSWTYVPAPAPAPAPIDVAKIAPRQPKEVTITVTSVVPKGADTVASLDEKVTYELVPENKEKNKPAVLSEVLVKSTITCNAKGKFEISPDSFFFSGEPGGYRGMTLDKIERSKDTSLKLTKGTIGDQPWREDIIATFKREITKGSNAKISNGKLEIERSFTPETPEMVITPTGQQFPKAEKLHLVTTGRITLDTPVSPTPKPAELPANWITKFWFEENVGLVQTLNSYAHMYQLRDVSSK
jgi:hypothetical protein